ncbi:hypothetical protein FSP39_007098 [Pinctada imbricata]|uniref:Integrase catalytic domain-containing protein n=1 Tax=Pinctada imbricata TaxID=66713 RepID=A0AA88YRQ3_PINIB|nr:hypothetical protein FSP39_007098 [Pinctada imbricata]
MRYSYQGINTIEFRGTRKHANADALSRLPLPTDTVKPVDNDPVEMFYSTHFNDLPVSCVQIRRETQRDPVLSQVLDFVIRGHFPDTADELLKPYFNRRSELNAYNGCVTWENRVIIPNILREKVMAELHSGHIGIVKMKAIARSYIWWPKMDEAIEETCNACSGCKRVQSAPSAAPVHPWNLPPAPWYRLHVDFAGPFYNSMFLIVVDAYSKWPEVFEMRTTTTAARINVLRTLFARQGIPNELVSDNGPQFRSEEFRLFMESNAIRHITSAPFHPRTNGQAERFVQSFKKAIKSATGGSINEKLNVFLSKYRITPQGTTNESPSMLLYGRNIRTRMDILKPDVTQTVLRKQFQMESSKHTGDKIRTFAPGDPVSIRDYRNNGEKWAYGRVHSQTGPLSYKVDVNGTLWRRHIDQLASATNSQVKGHLSDTCDSVEIPPLNPPISQPIAVPNNPTKIVNPKLSQGRESQSEISVPRRNPIRIRKAPDRLNLWIGA